MTSIPKPGPKPGASIKPGPRPRAHAQAHKAKPAVTNPTQDPNKWGRIDSEGSVFLITPSGERKIGSWQAGTIDEGLAHYAARYSDLATEISLLETRLRTHRADTAHVREKVAELKAALPTAAVIGDIAALDSRLDALMVSAEEASISEQQREVELRAQAIARKEALIAEVEDIADNSTDWKGAGDRIRDILEEWRTIKGIDRETDDALWKRYSRARDAFNRRRGSHFADLDRLRAEAKRTKEALVEEAQQLQDSTEWNETAQAFRDLMSKWKKAGRAPREVDDQLWAAFKAAQDHFFAARQALNDERDREFEENARAKDALIAEYSELINPAEDLDLARQNLHELQEKWENIGFVPRERVREFEEKISALEKLVSDSAEATWRRTDPEAQARAAQFAEKATEFSAQADQAEAKGNAKKATALREQAAQWQQWADAAMQALNDL